jgi:hypothetical protein
VLNADLCGQEHPEYYNSGIIYHGTTWRNADGRTYYDGAVPPGKVGCNMRHTYLHELGHAWSEGHSSISTALMYPTANAATGVDGYAAAELNAVYGALASSGSGGSGCYSSSDTSIAYCPSAVLEAKAKLLQEAQAVLNAPSTEHGTAE